MWNEDRCARNYFLKMSRGQVDFVLPGDTAPNGNVPVTTQNVYGPYELSVAASYDKDITYSNADYYFGGRYLEGSFSVAREQAASDGFSSSDYDYIFYITPGSDAGTPDWKRLGANYIHLKGLRNTA